MILLADVLTADAGPSPSWPIVASTGAILALLAATLWQGREIVALREAVKKLQEPPIPPSSTGTAGRKSKPMFTGLYAEKVPGALDGLGRLPAAPAMCLAGLLAVAALGVGLLGGTRAAETDTASRAQLDSMRTQLDTLSGRVRTMNDSPQLVAFTTPKPAPVATKPAAARRVASRSVTIPAAPQILPAPILPGAP